jgi:DNA repair exonuclease SbcCD ATPase subunit
MENVKSELERRNTTLTSDCDAMEAKLESLKVDHARLEKSLQKDREDIASNKSAIAVLVSKNGVDEARKEKINGLLSQIATASSALNDIEFQIKDLNPSQTDSDLKRLARAKVQLEELRLVKMDEIAGLKAVFRSEGLTDPKGDWLNAQAAYESAEEAYKVEERKAKSIRLLYDLYSEGHAERTSAFLNPFTERIHKYIRVISGDAVDVRIDYNDGTFGELSLSRKDFSDNQSFSFGSLSGGMREQLSAAVRLAMAEVLAAGHGNCMPMVMDDAFVNTDSGRIARVIPMLDLASRNGVQVIVLSCTPKEYYPLGAKNYILAGRVP